MKGVIMDTILPHFLDDDLLTKYRQQPIVSGGFFRVVDGNYEVVNYLPGSAIRFWVNKENINFSTHWHPAVEIIMPLENGYTVIVGQVEYNLNPGDIFVIPAGELHHLIAPPSGTRLIFLFDVSILTKLKGFSYLTPYLSQPIIINKQSYGAIYEKEASLMAQMCNDYFSQDCLRELLIYSHLLNFFAYLGKFRMSMDDLHSSGGFNTSKQKSLIEKLNKVFDYLDKHYMDPITLEMVSDIAGFSKFHFSRIFKQCSGYNFLDYLCYLRIKSAENLLLNPEITITEIALQSGFASLSTFNRTFKKIKNCTPSEYRNLYNKSLHSL